MSGLASRAVRWLFSGIRLGQPYVAAIGAGISFIGWLRNRGNGRERIYARTLEPGEAVRVRYVEDDVVVGEEIVEG